jgi:hypothetical protein
MERRTLTTFCLRAGSLFILKNVSAKYPLCPHPLYVGLPLAAEKRLFHRPHTLLVGVAAFAVLKTRALYVILCDK